MKHSLSLAISVLLAGTAHQAAAARVSTAVGSGADIEMNEGGNANGTRTSLNTRWNTTDRNDVVGLRFDLTGYDLSTLKNASLNFVNYRTNTVRYVDMYGVNPGETGGSGLYTTETWSEGLTTWDDFPGLLVSDGTLTTLSIDTTKLTQLVDGYTITNLNQGTVESVSSPELVSFIQNLPGTTITILLTQDADRTSGGQFRFASKEAASLDGGTPTGLPGDFAPFLEIDARPLLFTTKQVSTTVGIGADIQMNELTDDGNGAAEDLNTRWNGIDRNELVGMRIDLSGLDPASMQNVSLNFVNYRDNTNRTVDIFAVTPGATGGSGLYTTETWAETNVTTWGDLPGLLVTDGTNSTLSIDPSNVTLVVDDFTTINLFEGTVESATSPALTAYLQGLTGATSITFVVTQGGGNSGGQFRFASKEAAVLTTVSGNPGDFAPYLEFDIPVAEPTIDGISLAAGPSIVLAWDAVADHLYGVERTTASPAVSNWVEVASGVLGADANTYMDAAPVEAHALYRVVDAGPRGPSEFFFDDFESGAAGWSVVANPGHQAGTTWELGTPDSGPFSAKSGVNAYATNLGGNFAPMANVSLLSPVIDLTAATAATLSFADYHDCDPYEIDTGTGLPLYDACEVFIRDETGAEIAALTDPVIGLGDFVTAWSPVDAALPAAALGRTIKLEFRFISDGTDQWPGWYIDNVRVGE